MKAFGLCPASCGEFVQGIAQEKEYLSSYAIDMYSKVTLEEKITDVIKGPYKSRKAIEKVFEYFKIPAYESKKISLNITSEIPTGKGMASSTADIGATIKATLSLLNKELKPEDISKIAAKIEPTDSIYIEENNIFNPLSGEVIKYLGRLKNTRVVILEPDQRISTIKIRQNLNYAELKENNKLIISEAFKLLEDGFKSNDLNLIGRASTISSLANENVHKKKFLREIISISQNYGAYGVNIAHSGSVIGILIDNQMNDKKLIEMLENENIKSFYNKIYTANIISGGIKGEQQCNTLKIL